MNPSILLMHSLGFAGGTIHQVAKETGLHPVEILNLRDLDVETPEGMESYNNGTKWAMNGKPIPKEAKGDKHFWAAVMDYFSE